MPTVAIVIDIDDDAHYFVSLRELVGTEYVERTRGVIACPLPPPEGGAMSAGLEELFRDALSGAMPDVTTVRSLGQYLWSSAVGPVEKKWADLVPERTILDVRAAALQRLPWEALQRKMQIMFQAQQTMFVRAPAEVAAIPAVDPPLRVLVLIGRTADNTLLWREELRALEVLGAQRPERFHVEVLAEPDVQTLKDECKDLQPHVLHVIAHGDIIGETRGVRIGDTATGYLLDADMVVNDLAYRFPVVVLNACHTGQATALEGVTGLSEAFRGNGTTATVCMQGAIRGTAAASFSAKFYSSLLQGNSLDQACLDGRLGIDKDGIDRWLPQLLMSAGPGPLLAPPQVVMGPDPAEAIDRAAERRRLVFALAPILEPPRLRAAIVYGEPQAGKTWVARGAGFLLRAAGAKVRYVDLKASSPLRWENVLRAIRDPASDDAPPTELLPAELFREFTAALNSVRQGLPPQSQAADLPPGPVIDDFGRIEPVSERTPDHIPVLFDLFRQALSATAADRGLFLVLDHLDHVDPDELARHLVPRLLQPIALGEVPNVSVVLVAGASALEPLRGLPAERVRIELPTAEQFKRFAAVYADVRSATSGCSPAMLEQYHSWVDATKIDGTWKLATLHRLYSASAGMVS
ncbi:CHAT domain-containing protein [Kribbella sp. NPDC050820]|uniref:CHAT domain-containing protein n=1 Tax=Kribbella sp. NPDC050820 TaxID=3155408 RepID=UPI0033F4A4BB